MPALPYGPDWLLRGGYGALVVWPVDAAGDPLSEDEVIVTRSVRPAAYQPSEEARVTGAGTRDTTGRTRPLVLDVVGWPEIARLRAWKTAGYAVKARLLAAGRGRHVVWEAPVPVSLLEFSDGRATLEGDRLTLETHLYDAPVTTNPDLLALSTWEEADDEAFTALPVPGLTVYAFIPAPHEDSGAVIGADLTIQAYGVDGTTLLATDTDPLPSLTLPAGTWVVRVHGAAMTAPTGESVRPVLTTRPASSALGPGGFLIHPTEESDPDGLVLLSGYGGGTVTEGSGATVTLNDATFDVPTVALGTPQITALRTAEGGGLVAISVLPAST